MTFFSGGNYYWIVQDNLVTQILNNSNKYQNRKHTSTSECRDDTHAGASADAEAREEKLLSRVVGDSEQALFLLDTLASRRCAELGISS